MNKSERSHLELEKLCSDEKIITKIASNIVNQWTYINVRKYKITKKDAINFFLNDEKGNIIFVDRIEGELENLEGKRILEIGCGKGGVISFLKLKGAIVFGLDVDRASLEITKLRVEKLDANGEGFVIQAAGETLPFRDESFDIVTCTSVLEHTQSAQKVLEQMVRVLAVGGFCCIVGPNPSFPRESHYKIFWLPFLPKRFAQFYLIHRGFNPDFFMKHVSYVPIPFIENVLKNKKMDIVNITERDIIKKFNIVSFDTIDNKPWLMSAIRLLKLLRLSAPASRLLISQHLYPGFFIIGKKRE